MERCRRNHEDCPKQLSRQGSRIIMHHIFWPRGLYQTDTERRFRDLSINQVPMCEFEEQTLHRDTEPPPKPTDRVMDYVVAQEQLRQELAARPLRRP